MPEYSNGETKVKFIHKKTGSTLKKGEKNTILNKKFKQNKSHNHTFCKRNR